MDQLVDLTDHLVEDVDDCLDQMKGINRYAGGQVAFQPDRPCIILRRAACEGLQEAPGRILPTKTRTRASGVCRGRRRRMTRSRSSRRWARRLL
jgi:hypothetical protein